MLANLLFINNEVNLECKSIIYKSWSYEVHLYVGKSIIYK